jgi:archaellum component FlaC
MAKRKKITIESLARMIAQGFVGVDKRFDLLEKRISLIDKRLEKVELEISHLRASLEMVKKDIGEIKTQMSIAQRLERLEEAVFGRTTEAK